MISSIIVELLSLSLAIVIVFLNWRIIKRFDFALEIYSNQISILYDMGRISNAIDLLVKNESQEDKITEEINEYYQKYLKPYYKESIMYTTKLQYILNDYNIERVLDSLQDYISKYNTYLLQYKSHPKISIQKINRLLNHRRTFHSILHNKFCYHLKHPYMSYFKEKFSIMRHRLKSLSFKFAN